MVDIYAVVQNPTSVSWYDYGWDIAKTCTKQLNN